MIVQDVEALHARSEAIEQQAETLQASLGASQMDITHFLESRMADRLEITELQSVNCTTLSMHCEVQQLQESGSHD
ncbi:hypothetical protein Tco_0634969 [Tanacetum coccineum]